ncbi:hypothetical protein MDA_GLEAN10017141 [Myotis davidii]|uniref:Uncharacterized protein n=1 Tax=Myotis davidii TaxID=225400 RepID=L5LJ26_MYODS|nr:hypothetical protein MDA_GLEAN10017141 [Myotis davidii]
MVASRMRHADLSWSGMTLLAEHITSGLPASPGGFCRQRGRSGHLLWGDHRLQGLKRVGPALFQQLCTVASLEAQSGSLVPAPLAALYEKHVSQIIVPFLKSLTAGKRQNQDATEPALRNYEASATTGTTRVVLCKERWLQFREWCHRVNKLQETRVCPGPKPGLDLEEVSSCKEWLINANHPPHAAAVSKS